MSGLRQTRCPKQLAGFLRQLSDRLEERVFFSEHLVNRIERKGPLLEVLELAEDDYSAGIAILVIQRDFLLRGCCQSMTNDSLMVRIQEDARAGENPVDLVGMPACSEGATMFEHVLLGVVVVLSAGIDEKGPGFTSADLASFEEQVGEFKPEQALAAAVDSKGP